jgi:hypothetical protein
MNIENKPPSTILDREIKVLAELSKLSISPHEASLLPPSDDLLQRWTYSH